MKLAPAIAAAAALLTALGPTVAYACPGAGSCGSGAGMSGYIAALGVGLLAGMGSIAAEKLFRRR